MPIKTLEQQAIASLHRLRSTWHAARTSRLNTIRGLLREFGVTIPVGATHVVPQVRQVLGDTATLLPGLLHATLANACDEIGAIEMNIRSVERQLETIARDMPAIVLVQTVPGIGLITATALVALIGDIQRFRTGRQFASYIGLTPKEDSSAQRRRLGGIRKQGDVHLRMLLIHGARSVLWHAKAATAPTLLQRWALSTAHRRGHNVAAVAVANKLARIVWAVWSHQRPFAATRGD